MEGHYLLCMFAMELAAWFRRMDLVARYGGEEFVVLLPDTDRREALRLAEELRRFVERYPFRGRESQPAVN